ncbi:hypothetical protein ASF45_23950 [Pseudorhodoferax sp. Leaf265]|nr:hypothetical protein ASF45_23950 [Pseudorhodoferax sp. Leaf265]
MRNCVAGPRCKDGKTTLTIFWIVGRSHQSTAQGGSQLHFLRTNQVTKSIGFSRKSKQHCWRLVDRKVCANCQGKLARAMAIGEHHRVGGQLLPFHDHTRDPVPCDFDRVNGSLADTCSGNLRTRQQLACECSGFQREIVGRPGCQ